MKHAAFPRGIIDLVVLYADDADRRMAEAMAGVDLKALKVRERVTLGVRKRIEAVAGTKEASRRAAAIFALPQNSIDAMQSVYRTVDAIWKAVGDTSADFNFYTKRALLAGVYTSTMLHWFADASEGAKDTWAFLDARIANVMEIEKFKATAGKFLDPRAGRRPPSQCRSAPRETSSSRPTRLGTGPSTATNRTTP